MIKDSEIQEIFSKLKDKRLITARSVFTIENIEYHPDGMFHVWAILGDAGFRNSAMFNLDEIYTLLEGEEVTQNNFNGEIYDYREITYHLQERE